MWELLDENRTAFYQDMRGEGGARVTIKVSKGHTYTITSRMRTAIITRAVAAMNSCFAPTFFFF